MCNCMFCGRRHTTEFLGLLALHAHARNEGGTLIYIKSAAHDWWEEALWEVGQSSWASYNLYCIMHAHTMERKQIAGNSSNLGHAMVERYLSFAIWMQI